MYVIDQHAAHERVMLEQIAARRASRAINVQALLDPTLVHVSPQQA